MRARSATLLALVLAAALAGCSVPFGGSEDPTVTPASVPSPSGPADSEVSLSGVYRGEVVNARALAADHRAALINRTYVVAERSAWTATGVEVRDSRAVQTARTWYRGGEVRRHERQRYRVPMEGGGTPSWVNTSSYTTDGKRFVRTAMNDSVAYSAVASSTLSGRTRDNTTRTVAQFLTPSNTTITPIQFDGNDAYRIVGNGSSNELFSLTRDYTVRAVVQANGLVRRLTVSYTESVMGREQRLRYEMRLDPVAPDAIDRPAWLDNARNATG